MNFFFFIISEAIFFTYRLVDMKHGMETKVVITVSYLIEIK